MKIITMIAGLLVIPALALGFIYRAPIQDLVQVALKPTLPDERSVEDFAVPQIIPKAVEPAPIETKTGEEPSSVPNELPASVNLNVPFGAQAPFGDWSMPYQEACEEASMIMAHKYFEHAEITPEIMDEEIKKIVEWQINKFGYYADTNAAEMAITLKEYFGRDAEVRYEFTADDIKHALANGYPVLIALAGREIGNPYYTAPGPIYHVLVIKGYINGKFITNDPGTKRGKDYLYDPDVLINASHDWSFPNIKDGSKAIIIVKS